MYHLIFWEPTVSPHKLDWIGRLQERPEVLSCLYMSDAPLLRERIELGWSVEENLSVKIVVQPSRAQIFDVFMSFPDAIHIFSGMRRVPTIVYGLQIAIQLGARFGICSEPRVIEGWAGKARLFQSWLTEHSLRKHAEFVLAIGAHGRQWFKMAGYSPDRIYDFGYFVNPLSGSDMRPKTCRSNSPTISYVGRLVKDKGVDVFLEAAQQLTEFNKIVVGRGTLENSIQYIASKDASFTFLGAIPREEISHVLNDTDILILPSQTTSDGWGVIVSEALMSGCFTIVSRYAGASLAIANESIGSVLSDITPDSIVTSVRDAHARGMLTQKARNGRVNWADRELSATAGARRFIEILENFGCNRMPLKWPNELFEV